jgi:hypothetical protein
MIIIIVSTLLCVELDEFVINQIAYVLKPFFNFPFLKIDS